MFYLELQLNITSFNSSFWVIKYKKKTTRHIFQELDSIIQTQYIQIKIKSDEEKQQIWESEHLTKRWFKA